MRFPKIKDKMLQGFTPQAFVKKGMSDANPQANANVFKDEQINSIKPFKSVFKPKKPTKPSGY